MRLTSFQNQLVVVDASLYASSSHLMTGCLPLEEVMGSVSSTSGLGKSAKGFCQAERLMTMPMLAKRKRQKRTMHQMQLPT